MAQPKNRTMKETRMEGKLAGNMEFLTMDFA